MDDNKITRRPLLPGFIPGTKSFAAAIPRHHRTHLPPPAHEFHQTGGAFTQPPEGRVSRMIVVGPNRKGW